MMHHRCIIRCLRLIWDPNGWIVHFAIRLCLDLEILVWSKMCIRDRQDIGTGKQQLVEICKAISKDVQLLILDEPTASLNDEESEKLLNLVLEFKKQGITSILISHKLRELTMVGDAITVLRDGETIETLYKEKEPFSEDQIIHAMVGRELVNRFPPRTAEIGEVSLEIRNWNVFSPLDESRQILKNINMVAHKGCLLYTSRCV